MSWHGYALILNNSLNGPTMDSVEAAFQGLGNQIDPSPAKINHWRIRLDGEAIILETEWADAELTADSLKQYLADVVGLSVSQIEIVTTADAGDTVHDIKRNNTTYVYVRVFGGVGSDWETSRQACLAYLDANRAAWESAEV